MRDPVPEDVAHMTSAAQKPEFELAGHDNLLLQAALPLLNAIAQLRQTISHDDPAGLRQSLIEEVRLFEQRCKQAKLPFELLIGARYCLCSALDEAIAQTPWGTRGIWSGNGMLVTFHNESWGGEKFFQLLSRLSQNPAQHLWLLKLLHFCLLLGYEGRYRGSDSGRTQCDAIRKRLARLIDDSRPVRSAPLVEPQLILSRSARPMIPLWACATVAALIAGILYSALNWRLGHEAAPLLRAIYHTSLPQIAEGQQSSSPQALLNLHQRLSDVIAAGQLEVSDGPFGSKIVIPADKLFTEQGTAINPVGRALLARVASAMKNIKGSVLVSVYTDNRPATNSRFASSYEFSFTRAHAVTQLLQPQLLSGQSLRAEGRGDSDPLLPNDSRENRARNRRVEITLFAAPETDAHLQETR